MGNSVDRYFQYLQDRKNAMSTATTPPVPPPFPTAPVEYRYAISNHLRTDGVRCNMVAFDIRKPFVSPKSRSRIEDIQERFPNRASITRILGPDPKKVVVVGADPGEIISASFCGLDPRAPTVVTNLHVRRAALYAPTLSHRQAMKNMKRQRPVVINPSSIGPSTWASASETGSTGLELPSISELESSLPDKVFTSMTEHQEGQQSVLQFDSSTVRRGEQLKCWMSCRSYFTLAVGNGQGSL
ncbi:hypothetical protein B0O80DRAFT_235284 [Mortierella sp. GBAus27b]|nr:hypothetical protein B0O80DRAFT_235284 [Mortierella sp. GBAus27b]